MLWSKVRYNLHTYIHTYIHTYTYHAHSSTSSFPSASASSTLHLPEVTLRRPRKSALLLFTALFWSVFLFLVIISMYIVHRAILVSLLISCNHVNVYCSPRYFGQSQSYECMRLIFVCICAVLACVFVYVVTCICVTSFDSVHVSLHECTCCVQVHDSVCA